MQKKTTKQTETKKNANKAVDKCANRLSSIQ